MQGALRTINLLCDLRVPISSRSQFPLCAMEEELAWMVWRALARFLPQDESGQGRPSSTRVRSGRDVKVSGLKPHVL